MALINCPECHKPVSDQARSCPSCGHPLKGTGGLPMTGFPMGYEFKSKAMLFGLPLIHIASGVDPDGKIKVAKGIIAIGNIAIGVLAIGGVSLGGLCLGGVAAGILSLGGAALGLFAALGGLAIGYIAVGGAAIGYYAIGGLAIGVHTLYNDPEIMNFFNKMFRHTPRYLP